jgi:sugar lactone lactonase YvrE
MQPKSDSQRWGTRVGAMLAGGAIAAAIAILALAPRSGALANNATATIFVANSNCDSVTTYPAGANGNVAPLSPIAGLCGPTGVAFDAKGNIYVTNQYASTVTVYPAGSNGNAAPIAVIGGSNTGLDYPLGIALDAAGNIYVTNAYITNTVTIYPAGSNGNVAPSATIDLLNLGNVGQSSPSGIAVDAGGNIYVASLDLQNQNSTVTVYPAGSTGNARPSATIGGSNTGLEFSFNSAGIALDSRGNIYVANGMSNTVTVYQAGSNGNAAPSATISGINTDLNMPGGIALDASDNIYVTNGDQTLTIYPAGSNGNVAPSAMIAGSETDLNTRGGVALDASGNIYVANNQSNTVTVYPAESNGNVAPSSTLGSANTGMVTPHGIAVDASGNIYVTNLNISAVTVYPAGSGANVAPSATISGSSTDLNMPTGIALDGSGNIYVADSEGGESGAVTVYPPGSNGEVEPSSIIAGSNTDLNPTAIAVDAGGKTYVAGGQEVTVYPAESYGNVTPSATITGSQTGLDHASAIALDASGNIYVANNSATALGSTVTVYPAGSNGNVAPSSTIAGSNTGLDEPQGIAVDAGGNIYVTNYGSQQGGNDSITVYAAGSNGNVAPSATIVGPATQLAIPFGIAVSSGQPPILTPGTTPTPAAPTSTPTPTPMPEGGSLSVSTHSLSFGAIKMGKSHKLSFTIKNTAKTMLYCNVNDSALPPSLSVIAVAGSFALGHNKVQKVTVEAAPNDTGPFSGTITIDSGDPKRLIVSVTAKGRGEK